MYAITINVQGKALKDVRTNGKLILNYHFGFFSLLLCVYSIRWICTFGVLLCVLVIVAILLLLLPSPFVLCCCPFLAMTQTVVYLAAFEYDSYRRWLYQFRSKGSFSLCLCERDTSIWRIVQISDRTDEVFKTLGWVFLIFTERFFFLLELFFWKTSKKMFA